MVRAGGRPLGLLYLVMVILRVSYGYVCLFVCMGFNGIFSTNRLYRAITVG